MKRILVTFLAVLGVTAYAGAAALDFEGTEHTQFGWLAQSGGAGRGINKVSDGVISSNVMEAYVQNNNTGAIQHNSLTIDDGMYIEADVRVHYSSSAATGLLVKELNEATTTGGYTLTLVKSGSNVKMQLGCSKILGDPGNWNYHRDGRTHVSIGGQGYVSTTLGVSISSNTWYHIRVDVDEVGGALKLTAVATPYGGGSVLATLTYTDTGSEAELDAESVGVVFNSGGNGRSRTDNFNVVPEPASLALLGVGGVLALIRRRRR